MPRVLLLAGGAFAIALVAAASCAPGEVQCTACSKGNAAADVLETLPRIALSGKAVPSNLDAFAFVGCFGDPFPGSPTTDNSSCVLLPSFQSDGDVLSNALRGGATSPAAYLSSLLVYVFFGLSCAVVSMAVALCFCGLRCCCCCLAGGTCGKRYPTFAVGPYSCGFRAVKATPVAGARGSRPTRCRQWERCLVKGHREGGPPRYEYPLGSRMCVRVSLLVYAVILAAFVTVGQLSGNLGLTTSMLVRRRGVFKVC